MKPTVAIIGIGLIGGSLGQALKKTGRYRVLGIARKPSTIRSAKRLRAIDAGSVSLKDVYQADIVVIATPVSLIVPIIEKIRPYLKPRVIVTDVGSVKGTMHRQVRGVRFVGSHPLAGSHRAGVEYANPHLFEKATCVVVPQDRSALPAIKTMWKRVGARVVELPAPAHDALVAFSSHLPHVLAHALVQTALKSPAQRHLKALVAGSFRDATRVATADPDQWEQIFRENRPALLRAIHKFESELRHLKNSLRGSTLKGLLKKSQSYRSSLFNGI